MKLTDKPDTITWPIMHYVFIEKVGPFQDTAAKAWETLHQNMPEMSKQMKTLGFTSLYKVEPQMVYRAGVQVDAKPAALPEGFHYEKFPGGKYLRYVLTGSYSNLPEASGKVFERIGKERISLRDGFFIENYVNDPKTTPEDQLITEILIPID